MQVGCLTRFSDSCLRFSFSAVDIVDQILPKLRKLEWKVCEFRNCDKEIEFRAIKSLFKVDTRHNIVSHLAAAVRAWWTNLKKWFLSRDGSSAKFESLRPGNSSSGSEICRGKALCGLDSTAGRSVFNICSTPAVNDMSSYRSKFCADHAVHWVRLGLQIVAAQDWQMCS